MDITSRSGPLDTVFCSAAAAMTAVNAPTLINPAWPRLNSPMMPTVRFKDTAMTTYAQMGTSIPFREEVKRPPESIACITT